MCLHAITAAVFLALICQELAIAEGQTTSEISLVGEWKSDVAKTMEFNERHARLEAAQIRVLKQLFGKMTLTFTDAKCTMKTPETSIEKNGNTVEMEASEESFSYTVLAKTSDAIAVKATGVVHPTSESLAIWHFDGDYIWTYVGDSPFGWLHVREYFKRVK